MPPTVVQADQLLNAFIAALRDEIAAAKSAKGDSVTSLTDGRRTDHGAEESTYTFLMERAVAAQDDAPVELEAGGRRYAGRVLCVNGDEISVVVNTADDLGPEIAHAGLVTNLAFLAECLRNRLKLVRDGKEPADLDLALRVFSRQLGAEDVARQAPEMPPLAPGPAMNASQRLAVEGAQARPVSFVWGPPGTGKTATLARIAETFLRRGMRVLVAAHSNVAVDEATRDIGVLLSGTPWYQNREILRLGHHRHEALEQYDRILFSRYGKTLRRRLGSDRAALAEAERRVIDRARIICATLTHTFSTGLFPEAPFDACLIDEASMAPMPALFWALSRARRHAVVCGDFLQLPPVALAGTPIARRWLGRNIYQHLGITTPDIARDDPRVSLLNTQYRMHPRIAEIPNRLFYDGVLFTDPGTAGRPGDQTHPLVLVDTSGAAPWCVRLQRGSRVNLHSAHVAATLAAMLAGTPPEPGKVAIITPYAAQARLLGAFIRDLGLSRAVRVATVHRFQGGEVPALIFDTVEAPPERPAPMLDDTREPGARLLLNVALTRPQETLVVVADAAYLGRMFEDGAALPRIMGALARHGRIMPSHVITESEDATLERFGADIASARHEIVAALPAGDGAGTVTDLLTGAERRGVRVTVHDGSARATGASGNGEAGSTAARLPRPLVVIDRRVIWDGCPRAGGPTASNGLARRIASARVASALVHAIMTAAPVTDGNGQKHEDVVETREGCPRCGGVLHAAIGGPYVLLRCEQAPACPFRRRLRKSDRIPTDRRCPSCGQPMIMRAGKFGPAYLGCSGYPGCKKTVTLGRRSA